MPDDVNVVALVGRLTADPELAQAGSTDVLRMRLAVNRRAKISGEWTDRAHFFTVDMFGARVAGLQQYLHKGSRIALSGHLEFREWQSRDGSKRSVVQVIAENIEFMDAPQQQRLPARSDQERAERLERDVELVPGRSDVPNHEDESDDSDDIPF